MSDLLYKEEAFKIIGLCMEVHREPGKGQDDSLVWKRVILEKRSGSPPDLQK
jgi:hypothetical protein